MLGDRDLHELWHVEREGEGGDWDDVNQQPPRVCHCQADRSVLVGTADGNVPETSHFSFWSNHASWSSAKWYLVLG